MTNLLSHKVHLSPHDFERLQELRIQKPARNIPGQVMTRGAALADWVAETVGSWRFIVIQSVLLGIWIILNVMAFIQALGSISLHPAEFGTFVPSRLRCAHHHDERESSTRD